MIMESLERNKGGLSDAQWNELLRQVETANQTKLDLTLDMPETRITGQHSSYPNDHMRQVLRDEFKLTRWQRLLERVRRWINEH